MISQDIAGTEHWVVSSNSFKLDRDFTEKDVELKMRSILVNCGSNSSLCEALWSLAKNGRYITKDKLFAEVVEVALKKIQNS